MIYFQDHLLNIYDGDTLIPDCLSSDNQRINATPQRDTYFVQTEIQVWTKYVYVAIALCTTNFEVHYHYFKVSIHHVRCCRAKFDFFAISNNPHFFASHQGIETDSLVNPQVREDIHLT